MPRLATAGCDVLGTETPVWSLELGAASASQRRDRETRVNSSQLLFRMPGSVRWIWPQAFLADRLPADL